MVQEIKVNATQVFEIKSRQHWINSFPGALPELPAAEKCLFIDSNGNKMSQGSDFMAAENQKSYPIKVYLLQRAEHIENPEYLKKLHEYLGIKQKN